MKIKTSELIGPVLDWAVAKCEDVNIRISVLTGFATKLSFTSVRDAQGWHDAYYHPSTSWAQGGPIIEREKIDVARGNDIYFPAGNEKGDFYEPLWIASAKDARQRMHGPTPLIAAMRCYVASKMGGEVAVPEELLTSIL